MSFVHFSAQIPSISHAGVQVTAEKKQRYATVQQLNGHVLISKCFSQRQRRLLLPSTPESNASLLPINKTLDLSTTV
jgi:hypothetical protein